VSTATRVPETRLMSGEELSADDARAPLRRTGLRPLLRDSFIRFRYADGFSHSRALALQVCLSFIPAAIAFVGLSATVHRQGGGLVLMGVIERVTPGASRQVLSTALQSSQVRGQSGGLALWLGLLVALVSMATAMGQVERGANRIYGVERDRPTVRKYANAAALALLAGLPMALGMTLIAAGSPLGDSLAQVYHWTNTTHIVWEVARWPLGIVLALLSASVIFRRAPRRRQPGMSWLAYGAAVSLVLWAVFTALLALYVEGSSTFGATYGPLTAVMALMVWANLTSIALFLGVAVAAQLEACRAGLADPIRPDPGS
jgi:YihY family inner membrane protein